jgi:hypothetical protein
MILKILPDLNLLNSYYHEFLLGEIKICTAYLFLNWDFVAHIWLMQILSLLVACCQIINVLLTVHSVKWTKSQFKINMLCKSLFPPIKIHDNKSVCCLMPGKHFLTYIIVRTRYALIKWGCKFCFTSLFWQHFSNCQFK